MLNITFHTDKKGNIQHNRRDPDYIKGEKYTSVINHGNHETLIDHDIRDVYQKLFGDALEEYNQKCIKNKNPSRCRTMDQYIADRESEKKAYEKEKRRIAKIKDEKKREAAEKALFKKSPVKHNLFYETIVQIGNVHSVPNRGTKEREFFDDKLKKIYKDYLDQFQKKYGQNIYVTGAYLHFDELGVGHMHLDYVPYAQSIDKNGKVRGMAVQPSMTGALKNLGFKSEGMKYTDLMQFADAQRDMLSEIAKNHGIECGWEDRRRQGVKELKREHVSTEQYKIQKQNEMQKQIDQGFETIKKDREKLKEQKKSIKADVDKINADFAQRDDEIKKEKEDIEKKKKKIKEKEEVLEEKEEQMEKQIVEFADHVAAEEKRIDKKEAVADNLLNRIMQTITINDDNTINYHGGLDDLIDAKRDQNIMISIRDRDNQVNDILRTIDDRYTLRRVVDGVRDMGIRIDADIIKRAGLDDIDKDKNYY